ncbi:hypothetical protein ACUN0C_15690 [Faunimonas sp. B44]|uniref:hypothetical protein n=1 Tax=Faunimonas sp. B44 TaxID=3461493 RepID=UPI004044CAA9
MGDEFYNIAGDPDVATAGEYGQTRGWSVLSGFTNNGAFAFCAAQMSGPEGTWRFGYDSGRQWQVAILHEFSGETPYGSFAVDGRDSGISGWGDGLWVVLWVNLGEYEAITQGNRLDLRLGPIQRRMALRGTAAAALKVRECVENRGVAPGAGPRVSQIPSHSPGQGAVRPLGPAPTRPIGAAPARPLAAAPAPGRPFGSAPSPRMAGAGPSMPNPGNPGEVFVGNCRTFFAGYRCTATTLTPTGSYGEAMLVADPLGSEPNFIVQTDRRDVSQVWVAYPLEPATFKYLGLWNTSDGRCRRPMPDQDAEAEANLGHDTWELCIE